MRKIIYISVLLFSIFSAASAQEKFVYEDSTLLQNEKALTAPVEDIEVSDELIQSNYAEKPDTILYPNSLQLPYDSVKQWKNLKEYAYVKYLDSLLKNKKKEKDEVKEPPRSRGVLNDFLGSGFITGLLSILAILFVFFIIYRLFLAEGVFKRNSKAVIKEQDEVIEPEITKETDLDALIKTALQHGNYRQAVRYQYLRTLHTLADKSLVELAPDKTNYQYVNEIRNRDHQQAFAALTLNYEYVWYGEFNIDKETYGKIESGFTALNQKL